MFRIQFIILNISPWKKLYILIYYLGLCYLTRYNIARDILYHAVYHITRYIIPRDISLYMKKILTFFSSLAIWQAYSSLQNQDPVKGSPQTPRYHIAGMYGGFHGCSHDAKWRQPLGRFIGVEIADELANCLSQLYLCEETEKVFRIAINPSAAPVLK